jgi:hypothetical protein
MRSLAYLLALVLSSMGLTIVIVWPQTGPGAWFREKILRRLLPGSAKETLDCYICLSFWSGLLLSPLWWYWTREYWSWAGCLMAPALFWLALENPTDDAL